MHVLTLVVRCGFPKPLTVDPLTISLVDSRLQSVLSRVSSSAAFLCARWGTDASFYYSRKQAGKRKPGHMDKLQSERGSQARGHRKSVQAEQLSTSTAKVFFFFLSPSQRCDSRVVVQATEVGRNCYHKNLARTHPSHPPLVLISQPSREETTQHTRPSCPIIGLSLQQPSQNTHRHSHGEAINSVSIYKYWSVATRICDTAQGVRSWWVTRSLINTTHSVINPLMLYSQ